MLGSLGGVFRRLSLALVALAIASVGVTAATASAATAPATFTVQGSVQQVAVIGAKPGARATILAPDGMTVATKKVDAAGSVLFRDLLPATGWSVGIGEQRSERVSVMAPTDTPPPSFYSAQTINDGYGYLKTRDGTTLSINVKLPGPAALGPYPTVVEYSGYDPSNPNGRAAGVRDRARRSATRPSA